MSFRIHHAAAAIVFACLVSTAHAQVPSAWADVIRQFDSYVDADKVVGGSILYMRDGKVSESSGEKLAALRNHVFDILAK